MVIGAAYIEIQVFESHSLKEKRRVVRSLIERARHRFNAGIAEVAHQDTWQLAGLGITCVSGSASHVDQMLAEIVRFIEASLAFGALTDVQTEIIHLD
jgi:hypothetical protein